MKPGDAAHSKDWSNAETPRRRDKKEEKRPNAALFARF